MKMEKGYLIEERKMQKSSSIYGTYSEKLSFEFARIRGHAHRIKRGDPSFQGASPVHSRAEQQSGRPFERALAWRGAGIRQRPQHRP